MTVSIITINYNNLSGLKKTYESVVSQKYNDYEWILIDGGSTDGSADFIQEHSERFAFWCSEPDNGVYHAMNKGIALSKGDYLCFMNTGDCFASSDVLRSVFGNDLWGDVVYGDWIRVYPDREVFIQAPKKALEATLFFENICHQAMFIKSGELKRNGYDERIKIFADWRRWIDMVLDGRRFQYIPYIICKYEAESGISEKQSSQNKLDMDMVRGNVPNAISEIYRQMDRLFVYESSPLLKDTYGLMHEGRVFYHLIRINLSILKVIKSIIRNK